MISFFTNPRVTECKRNLEIDSYFDSVKNGEWQDIVLAYRTNKLTKKEIPAVTVSGTFKTRKAAELVEHSGFICIDVDQKDQIVDINPNKFDNDPYIYSYHKSLSGNGYAVFVKIDGNRHLDAFLGLEEHFFAIYKIVIDKSCKDTSRCRFVSYDPDLYINKKAKVFKNYIQKKKIKKEVKQIVVKSDFDDLVNQAASMNLFNDYDDYIKLCFALTSEFGELGRGYFHTLCSSSSKYDYKDSDEHYNKCLKRTEAGISIAFVYYKFKEAGLKIVSERTEHIKKIATLSDNPKEKLKELKINDPENLVEKFKKDKKEETEIDKIIDLIKLSNFKFNEITRNFEIDSVELNDRLLANFYTKVWQRIDDSISKDKIFTLIQNKDIVISYNPIIQWFEEHKHLKTNNEFDKLKSCFVINHKIMQDNELMQVTDYLDVYLKKWLLGVIGSSFGTYSLMILVLNGEQGTNKTEFFRNLLPQKLKTFYSESNLDEGKDSEILMTKKLLIIDDEFGGKSKRDATKLKRLSSQQTFTIRMPYGRISEDLKRLAVLGGTSNDNEVINDPTGNRRIIPINLVSFDLKKYKEIDKDLLFVELYNEWVKDKTAWFLTKEEIEFLNKTTLENQEVMSEEQLINDNFKPNAKVQMTNTDILREVNILLPSLKTNSKRIGQALKKCGFEQEIVKKNGKTIRVYRLSKISVTFESIVNQAII